MNKHCIKSIRPWPDGDPADVFYDALIAVVGFEQRASYLAKVFHHQAKKLFASAFDNRKVHGYDDNLHWFEQKGFEIKEHTDIEFKVWCQEILKTVLLGGSLPARICVDISSMTRLRIALLIAAICELI